MVMPTLRTILKLRGGERHSKAGCRTRHSRWRDNAGPIRSSPARSRCSRQGGGTFTAWHARLLTGVLAGLLATPALATSMFDDSYRPCGNAPTTLAIVSCIQSKTQAADKRLNASYAALQRGVEAGQREALRAAQRIWIQYRNANCAFYGAEEGTIRSIKAAECLRVMTFDRAVELEDAAKP